jgi:outer membrane lipoprotein SlyB
VTGGERVESNVGANAETAQRVGGGALIGTIIGAVVGGGKGAAIGAASGAAVGASTEIEVHGERVHVPPQSIVTFRLEEPMRLGWRDRGQNRDGGHFHD